MSPKRKLPAGYCRELVIAAILSSIGAAQKVEAQAVDIGTVDVQAAQPSGLPEITHDDAIGNNAPAGSAPALAPAQSRLSTDEPISVVSDKVIQDIIKPSADFNEALKFTPGFVNAQSGNGVGDTVGGWRGFGQSQYNVTFDGIPFGDLVDQHSANYFPAAFLGMTYVDRGPGDAAQPGYVSFGGTLGLTSKPLSNTPGGFISSTYGNYNTFTQDVLIQSGLLPTGGKFEVGFHHLGSDGLLDYGKETGNFGILKLEQPISDTWTLTALTQIGQEYYNSVGFATYAQYQQFGKSFGGLSGNPTWNNYYGYNDIRRQADFEYVDLKGSWLDFRIENKVYTYSVGYPVPGNAGRSTGVDGPDTLLSVKIPNPNGIGSITAPVVGVGPNDVTGYKRIDNTRAVGTLVDVARDFNAGVASGTLRTGVWVQSVNEHIVQDYFDYTTGQPYQSLGNQLQIYTKENLWSPVYSIYPYIQYEWKPVENLTIIPGYKFEYFSRTHDAIVNSTTLQPSYVTSADTANLPFLTARYRLNTATSVYAQASEGMLPPSQSAFYVFPTAQNKVYPERTENFQTGLVYKAGNLTADADLYLITAQHFATSTTDLMGITYYHDNGGAEYKGIEGELTYALTKGLALYTNGTYSSGRYTSGVDPNGNPHAGTAIGGVPHYTAVAGLIYDDGTYFGSVLTKVIGDSWGTQGSDQIVNPATGTAYTSNHVPAYEETDLVIGYRSDYLAKQFSFGKMAELKFGMNNVFDSRVVTDIKGTPTSNSAATAGLSYEFQPSRMFYAGIKVSF